MVHPPWGISGDYSRCSRRSATEGLEEDMHPGKRRVLEKNAGAQEESSAAQIKISEDATRAGRSIVGSKGDFRREDIMVFGFHAESIQPVLESSRKLQRGAAGSLVDCTGQAGLRIAAACASEDLQAFGQGQVFFYHDKDIANSHLSVRPSRECPSVRIDERRRVSWLGVQGFNREAVPPGGPALILESHCG